MNSLGWSIRCPDGLFRYHPFELESAADDECLTINRSACRFSAEGVLLPDDPVEWCDPLCPGGEHTVELVSYDEGELL